jgi:6-phosphogluconolactonase (cycloisomerase 2 family)
LRHEHTYHRIRPMSDMLYVGFQDDDKIVVFALDGDSAKLTITV